MDFDVESLSRLQFAATALYHFLFVPLTLGLSVIVAIMETIYVMTDKPIWRQMTKFWATLFGINFVLGVATGLTKEFEFGMNWSYYSHYVGDIFGAPLAIEGLMAFFLEATFVGLFFFGWKRLSKQAHLAAAWMVALGSNLSALWILIANGWMQFPVGAKFNPETFRMEVDNFVDVLFNPVAQAKFVHTVSAGYVTASIFVLGVSAWFLLKGRHQALAKKSMTVAASFGLAASLSVVVLGDESGYSAGENQQMKLAAIEGAWETHPAPAPFTLFGMPNQETRTTDAEVQVPYVLSIIATRSLTEEVIGINDLVEGYTNEEGVRVDGNKDRIRRGLIAFRRLERMREAREADPVNWRPTQADIDYFNNENSTGADLGYGLLLHKYLDEEQMSSAPITSPEVQEAIEAAAWDTVPTVWPLFWSFRLMVGLGFLFIAYTAFMFYRMSFKGGQISRTMLRFAVLAIPLPWIACELGWFVAEYGRQPWAVDGMLPTAVAVSSLTAAEVLITLAGFVALYSVMLVIEMRLMLRYINKGPYLDQDVVDAWNADRKRRTDAIAQSNGFSGAATPAE